MKQTKHLQQSLFQPGIQYDVSGKPVNSEQLKEWETLLRTGIEKLSFAEMKLVNHLEQLKNKSKNG